MPKIVNNEIYWNTNETVAHLGMSRQNFYRDARRRLHMYTFDGRKQPCYYKRDEVIALAEGRLEERPPLRISGILRDWTKHVRALGYQIDTINCMIEVGISLPSEICYWLGVPHTSAFITRQRISFVNGIPICAWQTSYPLSLAGSFIDTIKHDESFDLVQAIRNSRGLTIKKAKDRFYARPATMTEQTLLQLKRPEPILQLQRAAYTEQGLLILYSDMSLLGSWFQPEISYPVDIW